MKLVRIVHVVTVPESLQFVSGQAGYLKPYGFSTEAVASPGDRLVQFGVREQVEVHAVPMARKITPMEDLITVYRLWRIFRHLRPHIVHAHTPKGGLLGTIAGWLARVPVRIYHIHGLPYMTARGWKRRLLQATEFISSALSHRVLCVSHSVASVAVTDGICPQPKIWVALGGSSNGVDAMGRFNRANLPPGTREAMRQKLGIPVDATVVGYVGRIVKDKGINELAGAWGRLSEMFPDLYLVMVGTFEETDPLADEVKVFLHSAPRIILAGLQEEMPAVYAVFDLLVLPTYREGLPNVCLEAGAMELPVVATAVPGCIDVVKDGETGKLVLPYDEVALADAIAFYTQDPKSRVQHGRAGRNRILEVFNQENIWAAVREEYGRLLSARVVD